MKKKQTPWVKDVEQLVKQTDLADATEKVWDKFDNALNQLDEASRKLLKEFFDGSDVDELSRRMKVAKPELEAWLTRARRELVNNLKQGFQVRQ